MDTASTSAQSARQAARATAEDAREGLREAGTAAAESSSTIQKDLQALREDLARLAEKISSIVSSRGNATWRRARTSVDDVMADAQAKGQEAVQEAFGAMRDVSDNFVDAIDESLKNRPYTTLAIAAGLGFLLGAAWRR